jgi:predicted AlkP superfamily phosphohydrolase/phosphomutase
VNRVLVIGWDGATWDIAESLCAAGRLPTLAALRSAGAAGLLRSVPNTNSAPAWSSIVTGLNPGRHGIFYFDEPVPGTHRRRMVNAQRRVGATVWRLASDAGRRVVVVNVPISYPAEPVRGALVAGLDTPKKSLPGFTHPPNLVTRHADVFKDYFIEPGVPSLVRSGRTREAITGLMKSVDGWLAVASLLFDEVDWDLAFVVFTSTDTAQHFFWTERGARTIIERVYEAQDAATRQLIERATAADPEVNVMIVSDHGGAANTRGPEFMPTWLEDQGLMSRGRSSVKGRAVSAAFRVANRVWTADQKKALARRMPELRGWAESEALFGDIDWSRTRAYSDGVRDEVLVNVVGQGQIGGVGLEEHGTFVSQLKDALSDLRELDTGRPVVEWVRSRDELYQGPFVDRAPDITVRWLFDGPFQGFECDTARGRSRMKELAERAPFQSGGHHPDGLFVAHGPNIRKSTGVVGDLVDVTPTILSLLGVAIPRELDGEPLTVLTDVTPALDEERKTDQGSREAVAGYTEEEEDAIRQRLQDMGYL